MPDEFITPEQLEEKLKAFAEENARSFNSAINGAMSKINKESAKSLQEAMAPLIEQVKIATTVKGEFDAIKKLIEEEEKPPAPTPTQSEDFKKMLAEAIAKAEGDYKKQLSEQAKRTAAIEQALEAEKQNAARIQKEALSASRKRDAVATIAALRDSGIPVLKDLEGLLFDKLLSDGLLAETDDGFVYRTQIPDPYQEGAKLNQDKVLKDSLPELVLSRYQQFVQPRPGIGTNATTASNSYSPQTKHLTQNTTSEDLMKAAQDPAKWSELLKEAATQMGLG